MQDVCLSKAPWVSANNLASAVSRRANARTVFKEMVLMA